MSAVTKEPSYLDRNQGWLKDTWKSADFRPAVTRCYGVEAVPRNYWQGVTVGAWVRYNGQVWQVWSWHRERAFVWLANGERYTDARVQSCEVIGQAGDETLIEVAS